MAYKVFTNGSTLQASEVNDNLMKQAVATFSNSAARTAAITSPVEGQLTYLEDTNQYASWDGSAWVSPFGLTLLSTVNFTSATTVNLNNVFNSTYTNYQVLVTISNASAGTNVSLRMRASGADSATAYFRAGVLTYSDTSAIDSDRAHNSTLSLLTYMNAGDAASGTITLFRPNVAVNTHFTYTFQGNFVSNYTYQSGATRHGVNTAYDGFSLISAAGNITGTVRVYGLRN